MLDRRLDTYHPVDAMHTIFQYKQEKKNLLGLFNRTEFFEMQILSLVARFLAEAHLQRAILILTCKLKIGTHILP